MQLYVMTVQQYPGFITSDEADRILGWLKDQPYTKEKFAPTANSNDVNVLHYRNKNIDFHLDGSLVRQIVYPKLSDIMADPCATHGAFLESHYPFSLHVDTVKTFDSKNFTAISDESNNRAVLIALNESTDFQTVFFDFYTDDIDQSYANIPELIPELPVPVYDKINDLSHLPNRARNLLAYHSINQAQGVTWQKGMALTWSRQQLHCSSNFYHKGIKQALVLFF